jgi:adenine-specific DNA-methyltransferase
MASRKTTIDQAASAPGVETLLHPEDVTRLNIPTAETSGLMTEAEVSAPPMMYPRNPDLDPQLVWRGKDALDAEPLSVPTVPIYIQEKVKPEALIRDLQRQTKLGSAAQADLFGEFDRIVDAEEKLEFYQHPENWSNRMILGDSLLVMNSLAEKEGLKGQVQCIYLDPPYGIRFSSNWQPSTKEPKADDRSEKGLSREPEQIKAFRDTWQDGIHSYLTYLRDRIVLARELLNDSGSIFVQIGDENVHRVRAVLDEVFRAENFFSSISYKTTTSAGGPSGANRSLAGVSDNVLWYAKDIDMIKYRALYKRKGFGDEGASAYTLFVMPDGTRRRMTVAERAEHVPWPPNAQVAGLDNLTSRSGVDKTRFAITIDDRTFTPHTSVWKTSEGGMRRLQSAGRVGLAGNTPRYVRFLNDFPAFPLTNLWNDTSIAGFAADKVYVVQTSLRIIERCVLMATDPGDLVFDPTCGSGTTAFVAEQWGRRWVTIDTSRVALALARTRMMAARHPAHLLRDSKEGAAKEAELMGQPISDDTFHGDIRQGFVLERVPHVTLKSIANNAEIDIIHEKWQPALDTARIALSTGINGSLEEWQMPRKLPDNVPSEARQSLDTFWRTRLERQAEIDASIARNADVEYLHDRPYQKKNTVRVTGPFTVESLSPHRVLPIDQEDPALLEALSTASGEPLPPRRPLRTKPDPVDSGNDFVTAVLDNLAKAGVQNTRKNERLTFATIRPWPGQGYVAAEATYQEAGTQRRAAIVIGPEYGTVGQELVREAARECRDWADALVICGFAFDPQVGETTMNLGRLVVLKARMSQELHAAEAYKAGGGNLFVVFGEPDIALDRDPSGQCIVKLLGVDIFDPTTGEVRSSGRVEDDVACWFIDTDYDGDSFFVRHAYFLGGKDPYEKLKAALKADVDADAWASLYSKQSRPFAPPKSGRVAVKVINHYGDEAMRVFKVA